MSGKIIGIVILLCAAIGGGALYYLQVYAYYSQLDAPEPGVIAATPLSGGAPEAIAYTGFQGIDAESSPIRYRACFETDLSLEEAAARFAPYKEATPRNAPDWFSCFDAQALGAELDAGTAQAFTGALNIEFGIDRIIALTADGRGFVWHTVNDCGDKHYDGTPKGTDCPDRPSTEEGQN